MTARPPRFGIALRFLFVAFLGLLAALSLGQVQTFNLNVNSVPLTGVAVTATPADFNGVSSGNTNFTLSYTGRQTATITAPTLSTGHEFIQWDIDGTVQTAGQNQIRVPMNNTTHTVTAEYSRLITVNSTNPTSGVAITNSTDLDGTTSGTTSYQLHYANDTRQTFTAPANVGNNPFIHWLVNGRAQANGATRITVPITNDAVLVAVYQPTNVLTIASQDPASGVAIANSPADNNGVTTGNTTYTTVYNTGTAVTLTAPSAQGNNPFDHWVVGGVSQPQGQVAVTTTLNADTTATAVFITPTAAISVQSLNPGSGVPITASPRDNSGTTNGSTTFSLTYNLGTAVTLTAPASVGNNPFDHWIVGRVNQPKGQVAVTFTVGGQTTVTAVYQPTNVLTVQSQDPASGVAITYTPADNAGKTSGNTTFTSIYDTGTAVTLTAPATSGLNTFLHWTVSGSAQPDGQLAVTTTLNADTTVVAVYQTPNFALSVQSQNPNSGVAVTAAPADNAGLTSGNTSFTLNYPAGTNVTLKAPASEGNNPFLHWTINGVNQSAGITTATFTMTAATTAVAVYQSTNVLTVQSLDPASGVPITYTPADNAGKTSGTTAYTSIYNTGTAVTLTAPANSGLNTFLHWTIAGVAQPDGQVAVTTTLNADTTAVAVYQTPNFALTVESQSPASGVAITASPADNAGVTSGNTTFTLNYSAGASVTLKAPATVGNNPFLHWSINGVNQPAGQTSITVSMTAANTVVAVYQSTNVVTVQSQNPASGVAIGVSPADNSGKTSGNTQYTLLYNTGTSVTFTAPATSGLNLFDHWVVNGASQGAGNATLTTTISSDTTIVAVYRTPSFGVTVESENPNSGLTVTAAPADSNGKTSGSTTFNLSYLAGTSITLTAPATSGNNPFLHWTLNGVNQPAGQTSVTFTVAATDTAVAVYQPTNVLTVQSQNPASGIAVGVSPTDNTGKTTGNTQFTLIYNTGTSVTLTAPTTSGLNVFDHWTVNGTAQPIGVNTLTTIISADTTVVAIYRTPSFGVTVQSQNPDTGVTITDSPADSSGKTSGNTTFNLTYVAGTTITLTAPAKSGNNPFVRWVIDGVNEPAGQTAVTIRVTNADTAIAVYQPTNVLTVQSQDPTSGITVGVSPADNNGVKSGSTQFALIYNTGTSVTLTAPSTSGLNVFDHWVVNGTNQPLGTLTVTTTLNADTTVMAVYRTPSFGVSVQSQNPDSGVTITDSPADSSGKTSGNTSFNLTYVTGTTITLTAPAKSGNNPFIRWVIDGVNEPVGQTAVTIRVTNADTAVAVYQPTTVLTVQSQDPTSGVTIGTSPSDINGVKSGSTQFTLLYDTGASVTLTAPATAGLSVFDHWVVNGTAQPAGTLTLTTRMDADTTAIAVYRTPNFGVTVQSTNPGSGIKVTAAPADNTGLTSGSTTFNLSYAAGARVTLTAPAKSGNNPFIRWVVNGTNQTAGQTAVTFTVTGADTVVAQYQPTNVLTIGSSNPNSGVKVANSPADNSGVTNGTTQYTTIYNTGTSVTVTAPALVGVNTFLHWTVNGVTQTGANPAITLALNADTTVVAVYMTPNYSLSVQSTSPASGVQVTASPADNNGVTSGSTTFNLAYPNLTRVTLTAPAKVGNNPFLHWTVDGVNQPAGQLSTVVSITNANTAIAAYQSTNVLTVQSTNPTTGVAVSASPADNAGTTSGNTQFTLVYNTGSAVTLTAPALVNKQIFSNWIVNGVAQTTGQASVKVTMSADTTAVAVYNTPIYTVTTNVTGTHATVTPTPSGSVQLGGSLTFTATPQQGYVVNTWVLDGTVAQTGGNTFTLTNLQANHTLQVTTKVIATFHPADINKDGNLVIGEITAYGAAWKHGATWPVGPNPIPQSYVTVAVSLWKQGEAYTYDPTKPDPNGWIPLADAPFATRTMTAQIASGSTATETAQKQSDGSYTMTIQINGAGGVIASTIEENLPATAQVVSVGDGGFLDPKSHIIRWGPYLNGGSHTVTYRVRFKGSFGQTGVASFDGVNVAVKRDKTAGGK